MVKLRAQSLTPVVQVQVVVAHYTNLTMHIEPNNHFFVVPQRAQSPDCTGTLKWLISQIKRYRRVVHVSIAKHDLLS